MCVTFSIYKESQLVSYELKVDNETIPRVEETKYLVIIID